jgi:hypothetical protein
MQSTTVILTRVLDPTRKIAAIKNLRQATRPPVEVGQTMGLKEAKDIVDRLADPQLLATAEVEVYDLSALRESFDFDLAPAEGIDKQLVLDFLLDALAVSTPDSAIAITTRPTYRALREALR